LIGNEKVTVTDRQTCAKQYVFSSSKGGIKKRHITCLVFILHYEAF